MVAKAKLGWFKKSYITIAKEENILGHFLLLFIRLYWGILLIMAGVGKFANIGSTAQFFSEVGIPAPTFSVYLTAIFELVGGISLVLGFGARIFTIPLIIILITAYATAHSDLLLNIFQKPSDFTGGAPFLPLLASLVVLCFGAGMISIDYWLEKKAYGEPL